MSARAPAKDGTSSLRLALSFARRELRAGFRGFYVFLACLIMGVAAITAVQSVSRGMMDSLVHDGKQILGGDISLRKVFEPATPEQFRFLKKLGVLTVVIETRAMARTLDDSRAAMIELKGVDPYYPLYGKMEFTDGAGQPLDKATQELILPPVDPANPEVETDLWGAVVEPDLLEKLGVAVGDVIKVGDMQYRIRGVIAREPDRIGSSRFTLAPRLMVNNYSIEKTGLAQSGNQIYYDYRLFLPHLNTPEGIEQAQQQIVDAFPGENWRGRNFYNASPQIKRTIDQLTMFLTLIGLTTLLIGGVGISNAVRAFLEGKLASIATLKSLGAPRAFVARVFMAQIFYLATLGILVGLFLGLLLSQAAGEMVSAQLSLTNRVSVYPQALLLAAAFGYLTVVCFTLWPLGRAAETSPRELFRDLISPSQRRPRLNTILVIAIAAQALALLAIVTASDQRLAVWFAGGVMASFAVFHLYALGIQRLLRRIRPPRLPELRMALANLHRPGNVSASVILSLGLGLTVLSAISLVEYNMSRLIREDLAVDAPSFFFIDIQPDQKESFTALMESNDKVRGLQMTPSFRGRIVSVNGVPAEEALKDKSEQWVISSDRGFTYTANQPPYSRITEGEWWPEGYNTAQLGIPARVSIATDVAKAFDIGVGDKLTVSVLGMEIEAEVANVREINWSSFTMNFAVTFAPGALDDAPANYLATAVVTDPDAETGIQGQVAADYPNITSVRVREVLEAVEKFLSGVLQAVRASAALTLAAGVLVLAGGISAARQRHFYDAVVLKVLGATSGRILKTFLLEYGLLGLLTVFVACGIGALSSYGVITHIMELEWRFSLWAVVSVTLLCLLITLCAGFMGTLPALRRKPANYLRNQ